MVPVQIQPCGKATCFASSGADRWFLEVSRFFMPNFNVPAGQRMGQGVNREDLETLKKITQKLLVNFTNNYKEMAGNTLN